MLFELYTCGRDVDFVCFLNELDCDLIHCVAHVPFGSGALNAKHVTP